MKLKAVLRGVRAVLGASIGVVMCAALFVLLLAAMAWDASARLRGLFAVADTTTVRRGRPDWSR